MLRITLDVFNTETAPPYTSGRVFHLNGQQYLVYVSDYSSLKSQFSLQAIQEVQRRIDKEMEYLIKHVFKGQPRRDRNVTTLWNQAVKLATERVQTIESVFYQHKESAKLIKSVLEKMNNVHVAVVYFTESAIENTIELSDVYAQGQQMVTYHQTNYMCDKITFHTPSLTGDRINLLTVNAVPDEELPKGVFA